jgi:ring-1,2-phenylacetyl-CoA epoxidase subunit PaaD
MVSLEQVWKYLDEVEDPEIPVLNVVEMGIVRDVRFDEAGELEIVITPTYSGCPAMKAIEEDVLQCMADYHVAPVKVITQLSPAWTTDWMTDVAREKLRQTGIAPPEGRSADKGLLMGVKKDVRCPRCSSLQTTMVSQFGSTACKSLYKCDQCLEPFDYFKCI